MTKENLSPVVDRIKKLFALSKSPNENEAALALSRAQELMFKYNVEQEDLVTDEVDEIVEITFKVTARFSEYKNTLAYWIGQAFMVKPLLFKMKEVKYPSRTVHHIKFIGTKSDLSVATFVYGYLVDIIDAKALEYYHSIKSILGKHSPSESRKIKSDYSRGFVLALTEKFKAIIKLKMRNIYTEQVSNALVVVKEARIQKYIDDKEMDIKDRKGGSSDINPNHYYSGKDAGEKQGIHAGIGNKQPQSQPALAWRA